MELLAFDLGASSGKSVFGTFAGLSLDIELVERFRHRQIQAGDGLFWNLFGIYEKLLSGIAQAKAAHSQISSFGVDSFSNDFGLIDKAGRLLSPIRTYRDGRTARNEEEIYSRISKERLHRLSGNQNALFGTFMQLAAMNLEGQSFLLENAGNLLFLPDLFIYFLTGEIQSEFTISSVSQMLDIRRGEWSHEILNVFDIPERLLPRIVQSGSLVGTVSRTTSAMDGMQGIDAVAVCEHDTASSFLASPVGDDSIIISSGTWSLVGIETKSPIVNDFTFAHNIANEGGYPGHQRLLKNVMGLWLFQECLEHYRLQGAQYTTESMIELAKAAAPMRNMIHPNDAAFFSPGNMPEKTAAFCRNNGQTPPETPGEIIRTVLESLALHYRFVIEEIEEAAGRHYERINILGGGSQNGLLNQLAANACKRSVMAGPHEAAAIGNLLVQLIAHGELGSVADAREVVRNSFELKEYTPVDSALWDERYEEYLQMIAGKRGLNVG